MLLSPFSRSDGRINSLPIRFAVNYDPAAHNDLMPNLRQIDLRRRGPSPIWSDGSNLSGISPVRTVATPTPSPRGNRFPGHGFHGKHI